MEINPRWANYFDNAATTPLDPRVLEAMLPFLGDEFGNAHSIHQWGSRASEAVEKARVQVAMALGDDPSLVTFTSGASEANNWVIDEFDTGVISPFEHSSVREPALTKGFAIAASSGLDLEYEEPVRPTVEYMPPGTDEPMTVTMGPPEFEVQSVMLVNNEMGTRWDPRWHLGGDFHHTDVTQALGKIEFDGSVGDFITASAHKVYGPKGVGILSTGQGLSPLIRGGEQERNLRAGTLNVPGIVGFGAACALIEEQREPDWKLAVECRGAVFGELQYITDWQMNGVPDQEWEMLRSIPHILSISFLGIEGESLVVEADNAGFAISAGAACSSRSTEPSHVLTALGIEPEWIRGTIRISFGRFNTVEAASRLGKTLAKAVESLRSMRS